MTTFSIEVLALICYMLFVLSGGILLQAAIFKVFNHLVRGS